MATLATLAIDLQARTSKFAAGMKGAGKSTKGFGSAIETLRLGPLAALAASALSVTTIIGNVTKKFEELNNIALVSEKLGISSDALQVFHEAARRANISTQTFNTGLQRLLRRSAEGSDLTKSAFQALGISFDNFQKLNPEKRFLALADAFSKFEGSDEAILRAFNLFDTEGVVFLNILKQGTFELEQVRQRMEALGQISSEQAIENARQVNVAFQEMSSIVGNVNKQLGEFSAPGLLKVLQEVRDTVEVLSFLPRVLSDLTGGLVTAEQSVSGLAAIGRGGIPSLINILRNVTGTRTISDVQREGRETFERRQRIEDQRESFREQKKQTNILESIDRKTESTDQPTIEVSEFNL